MAGTTFIPFYPRRRGDWSLHVTQVQRPRSSKVFTTERLRPAQLLVGISSRATRCAKTLCS